MVRAISEAVEETIAVDTIMKAAEVDAHKGGVSEVNVGRDAQVKETTALPTESINHILQDLRLLILEVEAALVVARPEMPQ